MNTTLIVQFIAAFLVFAGVIAVLSWALYEGCRSIQRGIQREKENPGYKEMV